MAALLAPYAAGRGEYFAHLLIRRFGSLRTIYSASTEALVEALADAGERRTEIAAAIVGARRLAEAASRETLLGVPIETSAPAFRRYLVNRLGSRREECVMVVFFTDEGLYIAEDLYGGGQRSEIRIPLRRTVRRAFDLDARRLIIAHNHPSGVPRASASDIAATRRFREVVEALEIRLDDHCIVAGNCVASMHAMGLL
ncbi:JAB domain-containing protein [Novosphingobium barchaimii]|nr:JAB domain-containing protein [Novosphingobium barchaimii]